MSSVLTDYQKCIVEEMTNWQRKRWQAYGSVTDDEEMLLFACHERTGVTRDIRDVRRSVNERYKRRQQKRDTALLELDGAHQHRGWITWPFRRFLKATARLRMQRASRRANRK